MAPRTPVRAMIGPQDEAGTAAISGASGVIRSVDGVPIAYDSHGSGASALVLVHGWGCDRSYWSAQVRHFAPLRRVITVDLAGHGESGSGRSDRSIGNFGGDVAAVLAAEDVTEGTLVGHSLGGPVVVEAAIAARGRVAAVVGVDTFSDGWRLPAYSAALEGIEADFAGFVERQRHAMFLPTSPPALVDRIMADMALQHAASGIGAMRGLAGWGGARFAVALGELGVLGVPLGLVATSSRMEAIASLRAAESQLSVLRIVEMGGAGHFLMCEDPPRFNRLLTALDAELRSDPGR